MAPQSTNPQTVVYRVRLQNGKTLRFDGPEGMTADELQQALDEHQEDVARALGEPLQPPATGPAQPGVSEGVPDPGPIEVGQEMNAAMRWATDKDRQYATQLQAMVRAGRPYSEAVALAKSFGYPEGPNRQQYEYALSVPAAQRIAEVPQSGFDPAVARLREQRSTALGQADAAMRGAADSATLGFADPISAAVNALANGESYDQARARERLVNAVDQDMNPGLRLAGQLSGGFVVPYGAGARTPLELARVGAVSGAVHGFNTAEDWRSAPGNALAQGALGGAGGYVLGQAGRGVEALAARMPQRAPRPDYLDIAERYEIPAMPATVGGAASDVVQMGLRNLPGSYGVMQRGIAAENEGVGNALGRVARDIGTPGTPESAGEALVDGALSYQQSGREAANRLYGARDDAMNGPSAPVTLDDTRGAISDIAARYPTSKTLEELIKHPVIRRLSSIASEAGEELTLGEATEALSHVRSVERNLLRNGQDSTVITAQVSKVEQALENDVMRSAAAADQAAGRTPGAPGSAVAAQREADRFYADYKGALNGTFKLALKAGDAPEAVSAQRVFDTLAKSARIEGGNLSLLRDTWFRLPKEARDTFAATLLQDLGRARASSQNAAGDAFSYETFATEWSKLAPQARNILFGTKASKEIGEIASYIERLRDLGKGRNFSNTAKNQLTGAWLAYLGTRLFAGDALGATLTAVGPVASYAAGHAFLAAPLMRKWLRSALRLGGANIRTQSPTFVEQAARLTDKLPAIARAEPAIADSVLNLQARLSEFLPARTVAAFAADERDNRRDRVTQDRPVDRQNPQNKDAQP